jgi:chromatin remodeling complex protein RSC6
VYKMPKAKKVKSDAKSDTKTKSVAGSVKSKTAKKCDAPAVPVETPVVESSEASEPTLADDFTGFMGHLQQASALFSSLRTEFRTLEKRANRELKQAQKANAKRKRKTGNRSPSGFVKPTLISNELADFLGKDQGTEMARTEVTREINAYIRKHSLQDKSNGRKINPDGALQKLLKLNKSDELTYFNLQRYMSPHFAKGGVAPLASSM